MPRRFSMELADSAGIHLAFFGECPRQSVTTPVVYFCVNCSRRRHGFALVELRRNECCAISNTAVSTINIVRPELSGPFVSWHIFFDAAATFELPKVFQREI